MLNKKRNNNNMTVAILSAKRFLAPEPETDSHARDEKMKHGIPSLWQAIAFGDGIQCI